MSIAVLYDVGASTSQLGGVLRIVYLYPSILGNDPIHKKMFEPVGGSTINWTN